MNVALISAQMPVGRRCDLAHFTSADIDTSLRRQPDRFRVRIRRVLVNAPLDLATEMAKQALHRPSRAVAEGADRVSLDLLGDLHQHIDLALVGAAFGHTHEHAPHPSHALAARGALATAL